MNSSFLSFLHSTYLIPADDKSNPDDLRVLDAMENIDDDCDKYVMYGK